MSIRRNDDGEPNTFTFLFTDNAGNRIAELPLTNVSFGLALNSAGPFQGTLNLDDPRVQATNWLAASRPNKAQVWVDIDGTLVYGGRVTRCNYQRSKGLMQIGGADHLSYLAQRLQAGDYATTWATTAAGAAQIAHQIITDALAVSGSMSFGLSTPAATPSAYGITLAAPRQQRMTIDALMNMMSTLGYQVGFDFAVDVAYVAGVPTATLTLSYPRRGRVAGSTGLVLDVAQASEFVYDEDGTQQATSVAQTATGTGGVATVGTYEPAMSVDGYPLLEKLAMHANFSPTKTPQSVLNAFAADDLALAAYPVVSPQATMPMFAEPAIGDWIVGDDVRVIIPKVSGAQVVGVGNQFDQPVGFDSAVPFDEAGQAVLSGTPPMDPRFPNGMDFYWRITRADMKIPGEGVPTTQFTFNTPPASSPQRPPQ